MNNKTTKEKFKKIRVFSLLIILIVFLVTFFSLVDPKELVEGIGVRNAFLIAFLVSLFGGFSAGGSVTFISLLIAFVAGGINPVYLGLVSGVALAIGDMIMFYAGVKGRELIEGKWDQKIDQFASIIMKHNWSRRLLPFFAYFYVALTPFPNDILILSLAAIKYPRREMNLILILGDITFALAITILTAKIDMFLY